MAEGMIDPWASPCGLSLFVPLRAHEVKTDDGAKTSTTTAIAQTAMADRRLTPPPGLRRAGTLYFPGITCKYVSYMRGQVK
jgi:hypothetical protein